MRSAPKARLPPPELLVGTLFVSRRPSRPPGRRATFRVLGAVGFVVPDQAETPISRIPYHNELTMDATGAPLTLHFAIHSTAGAKSFQLDCACWKWSATPASES